MIKNLIYANQLKTRISEAKNTIEYKKHKKYNALDVPSPPNYTVAQLNDVFKRTTYFHL